MNSVPYLTLDMDVQHLRQSDIDALAARISAGVLGVADEGYDAARRVWNATIDRRPALIARCNATSDVQAAVKFAAEHRMLLSVRGGGHHIAGNAVAEGGLMLDLSAMKVITIDVRKRIARVGPGALLADLDRESQAHGLATPLGINSTTGVAGLALGGGFGWLTRRHGMTVDNLIGADRRHRRRRRARGLGDVGPGSVLGAARRRRQLRRRRRVRDPPASGRPGAATRGLVVYPFAQARKVLRAWRDFNAGAPDELSVWTVMRKAPPLPFIPASAHGSDVVVFPLVHCGSLATGEAAAAPVLQFGEPIASHLGPTPYAGFQQAFDPLLTPGGRNYWKSNNFNALSDAALDVMIAAAAACPGRNARSSSPRSAARWRASRPPRPHSSAATRTTS